MLTKYKTTIFGKYPKIVLFILAWGYLIYLIFFEKDIDAIQWSDFAMHRFSYVIVALFLVPLNWLLESMKWKFLISKVQYITLRKAYTYVLIGLNYALLTPNRIGEIPGRVSLLEKDNRIKGGVLTCIGSLSQFAVTIIFGALGILLFYLYINEEIGQRLNVLVIIFSSIALLIILLVGLKPHILFSILVTLKPLKKYNTDVLFFKQLGKYVLFKTFTLSLLRYLVFVLQFSLCILFFQTGLHFSIVFISVTVIYFFTTLIPTFAFAELGIRGPISVAVFSIVYPASINILFAAILIWILNIALPVMLGSVLMLRNKQ